MHLPNASGNVLIPNATFLVEITVLVVVTLGIEVLALVNVSRRSREELRELGGLPRAAWIVAILIVGPVGGLVYLVYAHLRLRTHARPS